MSFKDNLAKKIKKNNISIADLAKATMIKQSVIEEWLVGNNKPNYKQLEKLAQYLNCSLSELIDDEVLTYLMANRNQEQKNCQTKSWVQLAIQEKVLFLFKIIFLTVFTCLLVYCVFMLYQFLLKFSLRVINLPLFIYNIAFIYIIIGLLIAGRYIYLYLFQSIALNNQKIPLKDNNSMLNKGINLDNKKDNSYFIKILNFIENLLTKIIHLITKPFIGLFMIIVSINLIVFIILCGYLSQYYFKNYFFTYIWLVIISVVIFLILINYLCSCYLFTNKIKFNLFFSTLILCFVCGSLGCGLCLMEFSRMDRVFINGDLKTSNIYLTNDQNLNFHCYGRCKVDLVLDSELKDNEIHVSYFNDNYDLIFYNNENIKDVYCSRVGFEINDWRVFFDYLVQDKVFLINHQLIDLTFYANEKTISKIEY